MRQKLESSPQTTRCFPSPARGRKTDIQSGKTVPETARAQSTICRRHPNFQRFAHRTDARSLAGKNRNSFKLTTRASRGQQNPAAHFTNHGGGHFLFWQENERNQKYWNGNHPQYQSGEQDNPDVFADLDDFGFVLKVFHNVIGLVFVWLNGQFLLLLDFPAFVHDPGNEQNQETEAQPI